MMTKSNLALGKGAGEGDDPPRGGADPHREGGAPPRGGEDHLEGGRPTRSGNVINIKPKVHMAGGHLKWPRPKIIRVQRLDFTVQTWPTMI